MVIPQYFTCLLITILRIAYCYEILIKLVFDWLNVISFSIFYQIVYTFNSWNIYMGIPQNFSCFPLPYETLHIVAAVWSGHIWRIYCLFEWEYFIKTLASTTPPTFKWEFLRTLHTYQDLYIVTSLIGPILKEFLSFTKISSKKNMGRGNIYFCVKNNL